MKETYADYIIVNVGNYVITNPETQLSMSVSELKCLPKRFDKALNVGYDDSIERYLFSPILPFRLESDVFLGAGILCKKNEFNEMDVCGEVGAETSFYTRCLNIAQIIDDYKSEMSVEKDRQIINHLAKILSNMLSNRVMKMFAKTNNLALCYNAQNTIAKLDKRVKELDRLEDLVLGLQKYENEFRKERLNSFERNQ